jgi:hypothetical protein
MPCENGNGLRPKHMCRSFQSHLDSGIRHKNECFTEPYNTGPSIVLILITKQVRRLNYDADQNLHLSSHAQRHNICCHHL